MKIHPRSLALLIIANSLVFADPPALIALSASTPNTAGAQLTLSRYFSDAVYAQMGAEAGLTRYQSRWVDISQAMFGVGMEMESTSHLFYRATGSFGVGYILNPGDTGHSRSDLLQALRVSPQVVWYPYGRFSGTTLGLTIGINLEYRSSLNSRPLPGSLPGVNTQFVAGLVL